MAGSSLPPLSALRAFEAAARHLNFTRAGEELGMSQAAVSYQIKLLEERLGAPLFLRRARRLELAETGRRLAPGIIDAFTQIRSTVDAVRMDTRSTLTISSTQTFATHWLIHHIGAFQVAHPHIAVRIDVTDRLVDFGGENVDVGIRTGRRPEQWAGLEAHQLLQANFTPMMAPDLAEQVRTPDDLPNLPLIGPEDPWWQVWFDAAGVEVDMSTRRSDLLIDTQVLVASMAVAGRGAAVLTPAFFRRELEAGQLVQPFDLVCNRGYAYWLAFPKQRRLAPAIKAFRDWILQEVATADNAP